MKLLIFLLILPCCIHAQKVGQISGTFKLTKADIREAIATDRDAMCVMFHRIFIGPKSKVKMLYHWDDTLTLAIADTSDHYFTNTYVSCAEFAVYPLTPYQYETYYLPYSQTKFPLPEMHKWSVEDDEMYKNNLKQGISFHSKDRNDTTTVCYIFFIGRQSENIIQHGAVKVNTTRTILDTIEKVQNNFKVDDVSDCKCYFFVHEIWAVSFDSTVTAKLNTKDEFCPAKGDSLYYNGKVWRWHKKQLHLDGVAVFVTRPAPMKAKGRGGNSLVSDDSNHIKVYYINPHKKKQ